jgi:hypothetical protein
MKIDFGVAKGKTSSEVDEKGWKMLYAISNSTYPDLSPLREVV